MIENTITTEAWKMLAIPNAIHKNIVSNPIHCPYREKFFFLKSLENPANKLLNTDDIFKAIVSV
jgi:hypothetical protein